MRDATAMNSAAMVSRDGRCIEQATTLRPIEGLVT
jgi:hypothetical protein